MDKLQYDSFYKFLVSLGIILIALPVLASIFIVNSNSILISQIEYDALSTFSQNSVQNREQILTFIIQCLPIVTIILVPTGFILIGIGAVNWSKIQVQLDKQIEADTTIKTETAKKMSAAEVVKRAADEVEENTSPSGENQNTAPKPQNCIQKLLQIENACYKYFSAKYVDYFNYQQNVKYGKWEYDMLGISKRDTTDHLYEIKYWSNIPSNSLLVNSIRRLEDSGINYQALTNRNCKCRLVIVTPDTKYETIRMHCLMKLGEIQSHSKLEFISEKDLILEN